MPARRAAHDAVAMTGGARRRGVIAAVVLLAWAAGMAALVKREFLRPRFDRLSEAALRVAPGAVYYGVFQGDRLVGYASSTVDTTRTAILMRDYLVADVIGHGGRTERTSSRSTVTLSRGLHIREFSLETHGGTSPEEISGRMEGDSLVVVGVRRGLAPADTQRVRIDGPVLLPSLLPLALVLGERPQVGTQYQLPVFDPHGLEARQLSLPVDAESLFVLADSAVFDSTARRWVGALPDTVRAWHVTSRDAAGFTGWVDEMGRMVEGTRLGTLTVKRMPHEVAFENWRRGTAPAGDAVSDSAAQRTSATGAGITSGPPLARLVVRLRGADLRAYELLGGRQQLAGDTLRVTAGRPNATMANAGDFARAIVAWVHASIALRPSTRVPSALEVLRDRAGDANGKTQLAVALARARGLPARAASGFLYANGRFSYHAWPEFFLSGFAAADPTHGQFSADASHLRFFTGGIDRQAELTRLLDVLTVDVLQTSP
ncbi:MAG: transglutaminase-like domain-containing protein [Gemmatimonadaceae bacterium]